MSVPLQFALKAQSRHSSNSGYTTAHSHSECIIVIQPRGVCTSPARCVHLLAYCWLLPGGKNGCPSCECEEEKEEEGEEEEAV